MAHTLQTVRKSTSPKKPIDHARTVQDEARGSQRNQELIISNTLDRTIEFDPTGITTVAAGYKSSHCSGSCTVHELDEYMPSKSSDKNTMKHVSPAMPSQLPLKRRRETIDSDADGDSKRKKVKTVIERLDSMNKSLEGDLEHLEPTDVIMNAEHKKKLKKKVRGLRKAVLEIHAQLVKLKNEL